MKSKIKFILILLLMNFVHNANAQAIGTKKEVVLKFSFYECGDFCYLEMKDVKTGKSYMLSEMTDENTIDNGIMSAIEDAYNNDGNTSKFKGKLYTAIFEYKKTDEFIVESPDEPGRKTGKKINKWMLNSLTKKIK